MQIYTAQHSLTLAASALTNASIVIVCGGYWAAGDSITPACSTTNGTVSQYVDRGALYSANNDTTHARICAYITNFDKTSSMTISIDSLYNNTGLYLIVI